MPTIITKTVFTFDELSDSAKEKARDWFRQHVFTDSHDWEFVYDNAVTCGNIIGIDIGTKPVRLMNGGTRQDPSIYFSGFSSQGDGACFEGNYRYVKGATKAIRDHVPEDKKLHRIADTLQALQRKHFYRLTASMKHRGHYSHSGCMSVDVEDSENQYRDISNAEDDLAQLMRDFADWIYSQLEKEYEYQNSDEVVDESIRCNEYTFNESGIMEG